MIADAFIIPHLISRAAESSPSQVAVRFGVGELTYEDLCDRSARLAGALLEGGIRPGEPVGVHMAKSLDAVVAIHGILRAGAISVPIDPMAPEAAVASTVRSVGISAVVTDGRRATKFQAYPDGPLLFGVSNKDHPMAVSWADVAGHTAAPMPTVGGDDPAYMIMTSGSTGLPKAIVHTHRSGLRYAQLAARCYGLSSHDRLASVAPFHFDQSTFDLFAGPVGCSTTVLVPEPLLNFPADLSALVESEGVTVWYSVPTILIHLLKRGALDKRDLGSLRWVLFGGEVFGSATLGALMRAIPSARFSNVYGPAELNQCTHHHLDAPPAPDSSIPIGAPWGDTEVRVVDDDGSLIEHGGAGELHVRSATMMAGYWNRPDLTARAISTETTHGGLDERWYGTGDFVERDTAGLLHFLGRSDRQVKLRGNRVELEAVEAAVSDAPHVLTCAAVLVGEAEEQVLVAVVEAEAEVNTRDVIAHARTALPGYAVPSKVVVIDALPRTTSGKVDSRAASRQIDLGLTGATT